MQSEPGEVPKTGMAVENPMPGLNDNLKFLGRLLHVQTEAIAYPAPRIVTQVFSNGRVVFSRKSEIPPGGADPRKAEQTREQMRAQHSQTIREISEKQKRILANVNGNPR